MNVTFDDALQLTLELEGRTFTNHAKDLGGPTFWGLTQSTFDNYCEHRGLTPRLVQTLNPTEIGEVYKALFWNLPQDSEGKPISALLPSPANAVFMQLAVNLGGERATKLLQAAVFAAPDGVFGPKSYANLLVEDEVGNLSQSILRAQLAHYATVEQAWDAEGLYNRVVKVNEWLKTNCSLPTATSPTPTQKPGTSPSKSSS